MFKGELIFLIDYRYTLNKVVTIKYKYRVSVSAIMVSGINNTQNKLLASVSV